MLGIHSIDAAIFQFLCNKTKKKKISETYVIIALYTNLLNFLSLKIIRFVDLWPKFPVFTINHLIWTRVNDFMLEKNEKKKMREIRKLVKMLLHAKLDFNVLRNSNCSCKVKDNNGKKQQSNNSSKIV